MKLVVFVTLLLVFQAAVGKKRSKEQILQDLKTQDEEKTKQTQTLVEKFTKHQKQLFAVMKAHSDRTGFMGGMPDSMMYYQPPEAANKVLRPSEAAKICEDDWFCGGFVYLGGRDHDYPIRKGIQFFRYVNKLAIIRPPSVWKWTTYRAKRPVVVVPGKPLKDPATKEDLKANVETLTFVQSARNRDKVKEMPLNLTSVWFNRDPDADIDLQGAKEFNYDDHNVGDDRYWTVIANKLATRNVNAFQSVNVYFCCTNILPEVSIDFNPEFDDDIPVVDCEVDHFYEDYVLPAKPVKIRGCSWPSGKAWTADFMLKKLKVEGDLWNVQIDGNPTRQLPAVDILNVKRKKAILTLANATQTSNMGFKNFTKQFEIQNIVQSRNEVRLTSGKTTMFVNNVNAESSFVTVFQGPKWVALVPAVGMMFGVNDLGCSNSCSDSSDGWFTTMLPQLKNKKLPGGRRLLQTFLEPGETLYVPGLYSTVSYSPEESFDVRETFVPDCDAEFLEFSGQNALNPDSLSEEFKMRAAAMKTQLVIHQKFQNSFKYPHLIIH